MSTIQKMIERFVPQSVEPVPQMKLKCGRCNGSMKAIRIGGNTLPETVGNAVRSVCLLILLSFWIINVWALRPLPDIQSFARIEKTASLATQENNMYSTVNTFMRYVPSPFDLICLSVVVILSYRTPPKPIRKVWACGTCGCIHERFESIDEV